MASAPSECVAVAWAVIDAAGYPLPKTVDPTRRGAIVNWLGVYGGIMPMAAWSDERIEEEWRTRKRGARAAAVTVMEQADAN
jgi:hypothetical protein